MAVEPVEPVEPAAFLAAAPGSSSQERARPRRRGGLLMALILVAVVTFGLLAMGFLLLLPARMTPSSGSVSVTADQKPRPPEPPSRPEPLVYTEGKFRLSEALIAELSLSPEVVKRVEDLIEGLHARYEKAQEGKVQYGLDEQLRFTATVQPFRDEVALLPRLWADGLMQAAGDPVLERRFRERLHVSMFAPCAAHESDTRISLWKEGSQWRWVIKPRGASSRGGTGESLPVELAPYLDGLHEWLRARDWVVDGYRVKDDRIVVPDAAQDGGESTSVDDR